jgi:quercetin dioxygenase-like cupin family protein
MMARKDLLRKEANMYRSILKVGMIGVLFMILLIPSVAIAQGKELPGFRLFDTQEFLKVANPNTDKFYVTHIVTEKMGAKHLKALLLILPPASTGAKVAYHYHKDRESILYIISGTGNEIVDDVKVPIKAGDVLFILAGVKHTMENNSDKEIRFVEFFTHPPVGADWVKVEK